MATPTAHQVVENARKFVRSAKYGSPNQFTRWYGFGNQVVAWCAIFVYYNLAQTGGKSLMAGCANTAYCPTIWNWGKAKGYAIASSYTAKEGDLVLFDWELDGVCDHIGFVIKDNGNGTITTVEGNTSNISNGNGGCVQVRTRNKSVIKGYVRLPYANAKTTTTTVNKLSLTNATYPTTLEKGTPFTLKGTITAPKRLTRVEIGVVSQKTKQWVSGFKYDNKSLSGKSFDISKADASIKFGNLQEGSYYYRIWGWQDGTATKLMDKAFTVTKKYNVLKTGKVNAKAGLNVRRGPGTNYGKIRTLANQTPVKCYHVTNGWWKISPIKEEWVYAAYVK